MSAQPWSAKKRWSVLLLCLLFVPVVGFYGFKAWKHYSIQISTDNAYVQADIAQITPRLQGTVAEASVGENYWVKPGQVVVRLEPRDYKELAHAGAALGNAAQGEHAEHSLIKQAEAAVREAELNLSYCTLTAPIEGIVSRKSIEVGQRVQAGQPLMAIVPLHRVYIEANYKETQLTRVRVGQPAEIRADIYPDHVYRGKVESLSGGTGAAFSLLPPENATGNWVKVVQRLPVKIILTEPLPANLPLRVGLSVEVSIDTSDRQGPLLSSLHQGASQAPTTISPTAHLEPDQHSLAEPAGYHGK